MFEIDYKWVVAMLYIFFDVNYFIRAFFTLLFGGIFHRRCKITETTVLHGICLTNDVDVMLFHMNNARYLRELDFARYHFYERTRLFRRLLNARTLTLQTASCIRYRRSIGLFSIYAIHTKLAYWDERNVYLEHRFETSDRCVRAIGMSRQTILSGTVPALFENDPPEDSVPPRPPVPSEELRSWLSSMEASSQLIKSTSQAYSNQKDDGQTKFDGYINR